MTDYKIEFKRVERECPHNANIRAGKIKDNISRGGKKIIYDFQVIVNGEFRALLSSSGIHRKYDLMTPDCQDRIFEKPGDHLSYVEVLSQGEFYKTINILLDKGILPTLAQLEQIKRDKEQAEADQKAAVAEAARLGRIREAGPDLLSALNLLFADWKAMISEKHARIDGSKPGFALYPLAVTAQNAIDLATKEPAAQEPS